MRVRTIRRHDNTYGDVYTKNPGKLYDHPNPRVLIDGGYLEAVDDGSHRRASGTGAGSGGAAKSDGAKHPAKSAEKGS